MRARLPGRPASGHPPVFVPVAGVGGALSASALPTYASRVAHATARIVAAVRDDGPDELVAAIENVLAFAPPPGVNPVVALVTALAAQIDPDATLDQRLGWCAEFTGTAPTGCVEVLELIPGSLGEAVPMPEKERDKALRKAGAAARRRAEEGVAA